MASTENCRIRASIKKLSKRVPEKVESVRVSKNYPGKYRKRVESVWIPGKGRIPVSIEKVSGQVPEKGRIFFSTEKMVESGRVPGKLESLRVSKNSPDEY